ncbi:MAG TPA: DinB family protein [Bryobacteraceae bacterium]|nr:DinB family protein [Bryobacteraceae bacterium]
MIGLPERHESAPYYHSYIDQIPGGNIVHILETQMHETLGLLGGISEEKSLHRYEPGKWSVRELLNHVNDAERIFVHRALWFARGFDTPLPGFDQDTGVRAARADDFSWASHMEEFRAIRLSSLSFFARLPEAAWARSGTASGNPFTVRALAYIVAGHVAHHNGILKTRYL